MSGAQEAPEMMLSRSWSPRRSRASRNRGGRRGLGVTRCLLPLLPALRQHLGAVLGHPAPEGPGMVRSPLRGRGNPPERFARLPGAAGRPGSAPRRPPPRSAPPATLGCAAASASSRVLGTPRPGRDAAGTGEGAGGIPGSSSPRWVNSLSKTLRTTLGREKKARSLLQDFSGFSEAAGGRRRLRSAARRAPALCSASPGPRCLAGTRGSAPAPGPGHPPRFAPHRGLWRSRGAVMGLREVGPPWHLG